MDNNISMVTLNRLNMLEIDMLKSTLGITYNDKSGIFKLSKPLSTQLVVDVFRELKHTIWSKEKIQLIMPELEEVNPQKTRLYYFTPGYPSSIDSYVAKMGILNYEILYEDPLCFPLVVKPDYEDYILRNPVAYVRHVFEHAMSLIALEKWIKAGFLYLVPSIPLMDINAFWELGRASSEINEEKNLEGRKGFRDAFRYLTAEGTIKAFLEYLRLSKNNYTVANIKHIFPNMEETEAEKMLKQFREQTLIERENAAIQYVFKNNVLSKSEQQALIDNFLKSEKFNLERYVDISSLNQGLLQTTGMPLPHASYLSTKFQCIPSTDNPGLIYGYEGWCQALGADLGEKFEGVRSKVDLPFSYFDKVPIDTILKARNEGKAAKLSVYLSSQWEKIRTSKDIETYKAAANNYAETIKSDIVELRSEQKQMMDELLEDSIKTAAIGAGACITASLTTLIPVAIWGGILAAITPALAAKKSFDKSRAAIESQPLSIFLHAEDSVSQ